jgi:hypothetical protein
VPRSFSIMICTRTFCDQSYWNRTFCISSTVSNTQVSFSRVFQISRGRTNPMQYSLQADKIVVQNIERRSSPAQDVKVVLLVLGNSSTSQGNSWYTTLRLLDHTSEVIKTLTWGWWRLSFKTIDSTSFSCIHSWNKSIC